MVECIHCQGILSLGVFLLEVRWEALLFGPPSLLYYFTLSFILSHVCCPSSMCRVNLSKTDICPVSLIPESLGVVDKAEESGSVGYRVLSGKGSKGSFLEIFWIFFQICSCTLFYPSSQWSFGSAEDSRTKLSSAASPGHFVPYILELGP